nr:AMP-binding protein [Nocardia miyunensis]
MPAISNTELTPLSFLERSARVFPTKPAVVYGTTSWTYREFDDELRRIARALSTSGIGRGDRVAYLMPNLPEMLVAQYAVPAVGAVLVAINIRLSSDEIAYILGHSGACLLVADAEYADTVAAAVKQVPTVCAVADRRRRGRSPGRKGRVEVRGGAIRVHRLPGPARPWVSRERRHH